MLPFYLKRPVRLAALDYRQYAKLILQPVRLPTVKWGGGYHAPDRLQYETGVSCMAQGHKINDFKRSTCIFFLFDLNSSFMV